MEIPIAIAAKIVEYTVAPIGRWLCYSFHYSSNIGSMKKQVEKLRLARDTTQRSIDAAIRNGEAIEGVVNNWLKEVDEITEKAMKVVEDEEETKTRRSNAAACLDLKLRHQLSHKAKKIAQAIGVVLENCKFDKVSYRPAPQGMVTTRSTDYVDSNSRKSTVMRLMEALRDGKIHLIGVWGMAGVGKSTLVREVANQAKEEKLFDEVAIANVTQSPDLRRIQGEIADMLDLKFDVESTEIGREIRLRQRLTGTEEKKKILVILDDIWKNLNLEKIGIPSEGCKVLLTSRNRDVLVCEMGTQKDFGLEILLEEEAWSLFEKMAGDCVKDPNLERIATEVAKECEGLPLALVTVSKALKNKELFEWKDALQLLRRPAPEHLKEMQSSIYSHIELSYKHLENKEVQVVFLLCSQLGYHIHERDLLIYCYGWGLFHGIYTMEDARNRLHTILRILKDCCLLLQSPYSSKGLLMHDIVCDAATLIASRDHNMLVVRADGGLKEWPNADALKRCGVFSVLEGDINELPIKMECPELRFLHVHCDGRPLQISDTFFGGMAKLNVLDLTKMQLSSLPSSLHFLENLQTLCLDNCMLGDIAVIGKLKNLAILSLHNSYISQLPKEIGLLSHLQLLDLSNCSELEVIPPNVLSRLKALEELYMGNSFVQWKTEGLNNASLAELKHLSHLTTLEIQIPNASNLPKDMSFEKLERYIIYVGDEWDWSDRQEEDSRTLKLKLNTSFQLEVEIKMLLKRTEHLYLDELKGVKSVLPELDCEGFQQLKHVHIQNNLEIKYIMNGTMSVVAFPVLETFHLKNMTSLEEIFHGQLPKLTSFGKLRVVKVEHCDKLKYFFLSSIARGLSQLEELEIRECSIMSSIVMKEEGEIEDEDTASLFPQLRRLRLKRLPKLKSFLSIQNLLVTNAGKIIMEGKPDFHMPILHEQVVFPNLESLELFSIGLEDIQHNQNLATRSSCRIENMQSIPRFQNLLDLEVKGSNNIKYLLSFSSARFMEQLKYLSILECEVMEEILVTEDLRVVGETIPKVLFPRLEFLQLKKLPMLKRFCEGSDIKFPSLKDLFITNCPNLKSFISKPVSLDMMTSCREPKEMNAAESSHTAMQPLFNEAVSFPCLEVLAINEVDDLKIIWGNQFAVDSFYELKRIIVISCENLLNVFRSDMLAKFQSLEELRIRDCHSLQEVFEVQGMNVKESHDEVVFPNLESLELFSIGLEDIQHNQNLARRSSCRIENMQSIPRFQNLLHLEVKGSNNIKYLLSFSSARFMEQLKYLGILECEVMEEILVTEDLRVVGETIPKEFFPGLEFLKLKELPMLKRFCEGSNIKFPSLKDLIIDNCPNLKTFISKPVSLDMTTSCRELTEMNAAESPHTAMQPLFKEEVSFPCLERLVISQVDDLKIIWGNQFAVDSFYKLRRIEVYSCENILNVFPSDMLARFQSLEELIIRDCHSLQEVFGVQGMNVKECHVVRREGSKPIFSFQNLQIVHVVRCRSLKSLFPASVATCLTQLEKLVIIGCIVLEEIVVGEEAKQPIARFVFPRVTVLHLVGLPRLKWFYPGVHTSEWPMLKNMLVVYCPKVKIFASELSSFKDILGESQVEIPSKQPLFLVDDEVPFPSLEKLRIFCMSDLKIIWHNQFSANSFCKCEIIEDEFCENLICQQETSGVTATQLKELHLLHLPKLKHIWNKDPHEVHAIGGENMESPLPPIEIWFEHSVGKIALRYQNSGVSPEERIIEIGSC